MNIRVYRTFHWELDCSRSEIRYGGKNPVKLVSTDVLQFMDDEGEWKAIPIVEGPQPKHPDEEAAKRDMQTIDKWMTGIRNNAIVNAVISGEDASGLALLAQYAVSGEQLDMEEVNETLSGIKSQHAKKIAELILHPDWSSPYTDAAESIIKWASSLKKT